MRIHLYILLVNLTLLSCNQNKTGSQAERSPFTMTEAYVAELSWMNQPDSFTLTDSSLNIVTVKGSDFFNNPEDLSITGSAPYLYKTVQGDFVAKTLVQPDFTSHWNAAALMLYMDSLNWIKLAFENSDATGPGIVTVVTKGTSDDANGVMLNREARIWLAIARKDSVYSMHWSQNGETYKMARLTSMPGREEVKIGIEVQSPVGEKATHSILHFEIEEVSVKNLRNLH